MALKWNDSYGTGELQVDNQHKKLFEYIDKLEVQLNKGVTEKDCKDLLDFLGLFVRSHFCYEEICMRKYKCEAAATNKDEHTKLLDAYKGFLDRYEREGYSEDLVRQIHRTAEAWIVNHILKVDINMKECIDR